MENNEKIILICNDDGIDAKGLRLLAQAMTSCGKVYVVAPETQKSAASQALTIKVPLRVRKVNYIDNIDAFLVTGTPADCAKIGISTLLPRKPDLLISGINHGRNTSANVVYSGTIAAASEGVFSGVNSLAISLDDHSTDADFSASVYYGKVIAKKILDNGTKFPNCVCNVNVPVGKIDDIKGIKITPCSDARWVDKYEKRSDPFGGKYYWYAGEYEIMDKNPESDDEVVDKGYVAITPIKKEYFCERFLEDFNSIFNKTIK